ncbi:MAG: helix-turn-helix transcriptional regulator, partial [Bacillota bacterium]
NQLGLIHNHIHSAIAKYNLYGLTEASIELNKAFEIGKADHILMPFVENAAYIMPIIKSGLIYLSGEYYGDIVSMCGSYSSSILKDKVPVSILTIRETEVLSYLAKGNSQKDIADKLFISQNTVRRHL